MNNNDWMAKSKTCSRIIKVLRGSTSGTTYTFKNTTLINVLKRTEGKLTRGKNDCFDKVLSRMTALDGFPFKVFYTSIELRKLLIVRGLKNVPKSVLYYVKNYSNSVRNSLKKELIKLKLNDTKFSLVFKYKYSFKILF